MGWEGVREESDPWLYNNSLAPPKLRRVSFARRA